MLLLDLTAMETHFQAFSLTYSYSELGLNPLHAAARHVGSYSSVLETSDVQNIMLKRPYCLIRISDTVESC